MRQKIELDVLIDIAIAAGKEILKVYNDENIASAVDYKDDNSPLTLADQYANDLIVKELKNHYPHIPIISEEGKDISYLERKNWEYFWLVDPLDGTKEFIKRNGQFTVNIALIYKNLPIVGVIHAPVLKETWFGEADKGAGKIDSSGENRAITTRKEKEKMVAVRSSSHAAPEEENVLGKYPITGTISTGSSIKFCMVAEGKADIYYRHGPTMEWDTAAGQAIVEAAGGKVYKGNTAAEPFIYNKENLKNDGFLVLG